MSTRLVHGMWVGAMFVLVLLVLWFSRRVILLLFAGLLVALILTSLTNLLRKVMPIGHKLAFGIVLVLLAGLLWGTGLLVAPQVSDQFSQLAERVPQLLSEFREKIQNSAAFQKAEQILPDVQKMVPDGGIGRVGKVFSSTFEAVSGLIFIFFTAIFLAATPGVYRELLIKIFPPRLREDAEATLNKCICTLKYWLLGQTVSMLVVGVVTGVALAVAGVPLALALGIVAGFAEFIPILGPIFASIPALLIAMSEGTDTFLIVLGIFLVIQTLEGNVITPVVQRRAIDLPPVITLVALFVLGGAFGILGMFVAAPLASVVLVLIEDIYLQRQLGTKERLLTK